MFSYITDAETTGSNKSDSSLLERTVFDSVDTIDFETTFVSFCEHLKAFYVFFWKPLLTILEIDSIENEKMTGDFQLFHLQKHLS